MSLDDRTAQEKLTPDERRALLRALADRMLLKAASLDDPEDMAGVEKAVRVTAAIERIYYRCDRAEHHTPDPRKLEAERAVNQSAAIKARVKLASDLEWGEMRQKDLGKWWDAAQNATRATVQTQVLSPVAAPQASPQATLQKPAEPKPSETLAAQGADLHKHLASLSNKTLDRLFDKLPQNTSDRLANTSRILKARAALERGDITEDELDDFDEELDDWLQMRPPPD